MKGELISGFRKGLAGILLATSLLHGSEWLPKNYQEWKKHAEIGAKISNSRKDISNKLLEESISLDTSQEKYDKSISNFSRNLAGIEYNDFDKNIMLDLIKTHGFYIERIPEFFNNIRTFQQMHNKEIQKSCEEIAFDDTNKLLKDESFLNLLEKTYKTKEVNCKKISATYIAAYYTRSIDAEETLKREITFSLETGLIFHPEYAPLGVGHQWVRIEEKVIDPSIRADLGFRNMEDKFYIPIVVTTMVLNGKKAEGSSIVICYPANIEKEALDNLK